MNKIIEQSKIDQWPLDQPKNILIRMPNWIGDLVMATPIIEDVRKKWPNASITAMCQSSLGELLKYDPNINEIYSFKKPNGWIHQSQHFAIIDNLKRGDYDLGILLTNSFSSAWWFFLGKVANRIGFKGNVRDLFLNKAVPFPKNKEFQHLVLTYKSLLEPLGIPISDTAPRLYVSEDEKMAARKILSDQNHIHGKQILIGINPGAAYGSAKCWPKERFRKVTELLLQNPDITVVYFGDQAGASLVSEIQSGFGPRVINLAGKTTIRQLISLIDSCNVFLTNDSGPMHIAAALKVPLVAIFGSTSEIKTGPYGNGTVIHKHVECSPCYKRTCPIDFRCMKRIEADEVYEAITKIINR